MTTIHTYHATNDGHVLSVLRCEGSDTYHVCDELSSELWDTLYADEDSATAAAEAYMNDTYGTSWTN